MYQIHLAPATIAPALLACLYWPDIVVYSKELKAEAHLPIQFSYISSITDLSAAHQHREGKPEYQQIVAKLDRTLQVSTKLGCLGHYLNETITVTAMKSKLLPFQNST